MMNSNNKVMRSISRNFSFRGFTLIELIVVIALLGVVATLALVTLNPVAQLQKSNDAHRKADLEQLQHALELYYQDQQKYPVSSADFKIMNGATTLSWGSAWAPYMSTLPKDPYLGNTYVYYSPVSSAGQTYYLYAN